MIVYQQKCVEPVGESKSDYDIFVELADRLGYEEQFTEGNTWEELDQEDVRLVGHAQVHGLRGLQEEGLLRRPADRELQADLRPALVRRGPALRHARHEQPQARHRQGPRAGHRQRQDRVRLAEPACSTRPTTTSGRPCPSTSPAGKGTSRSWSRSIRCSSSRRIPRFSFHTHHDTRVPWLSEIPEHRMWIDGYNYQICRIHPQDAEARGIKHGDVIKLYNDRAAGPARGVRDRAGAGRAWCTPTRARPGTTRSSRAIPTAPTGAAASTCSRPGRMMSKNVPGMAPNSCLVEMAKWEG